MENSSYTKDKEKYVQDLERYEIIVKYFKKYKSEVNVNRNNLAFLKEVLYNSIKEESFVRDKSTELHNRLEHLLDKNLRGKLKSIEHSKEKKGSLIDQWIGELI